VIMRITTSLLLLSRGWRVHCVFFLTNLERFWENEVGSWKRRTEHRHSGI
jgi:hypothetical protein